jgi:pyruvate kinase
MQKTNTSNRQTKISTLGPACYWDVPMLENLMDEGLSVARFNLSRGYHDGHKSCLDHLHKAATNKKKDVCESEVAMMFDILLCFAFWTDV